MATKGQNKARADRARWLAIDKSPGGHLSGGATHKAGWGRGLSESALRERGVDPAAEVRPHRHPPLTALQEVVSMANGEDA